MVCGVDARDKATRCGFSSRKPDAWRDNEAVSEAGLGRWQACAAMSRPGSSAGLRGHERGPAQRPTFCLAVKRLQGDDVKGRKERGDE